MYQSISGPIGILEVIIFTYESAQISTQVRPTLGGRAVSFLISIMAT